MKLLYDSMFITLISNKGFFDSHDMNIILVEIGIQFLVVIKFLVYHN